MKGKHDLLPKDAADLLKKAAATPILKKDSLSRIKAIERAIEKIKIKYPQAFKWD